MPPTGLAAVIKRRWYLAVVGIIVTLALCAAAFVAFPAQYQAKAVVLLLPPASASVSGSQSAAGQNPYVSLGLVDGLNDVLAQAMTDSATGSVLLSAGLNGSYTVANDPATSGPLILITGTAKSSSMAVAITNRIVALVPETLLRLQQAAGVVDTKNNVTSTVLNPAATTVKVRKNQERGIIAAGVVGIVLTLLIIAAADKVLLARRRRLAQADDGAAEAAVSEVVPSEVDEPRPTPTALEPLAVTSGVESAPLRIADEPVELVGDDVEAAGATATEPLQSAQPVEVAEAAEPAGVAEPTEPTATVRPPSEDTAPRVNGASLAATTSISARESEPAEVGSMTTPSRRPDPTWRLKSGLRNPGRERTISRNGRPQPRFDSNQATKSPDEISRSV